MLEKPIIYNAKDCPSKELFDALICYLLLKTGKPLSALSIAKDLQKVFGIKTTYMTVQKYIGYMVKAGFVDCVAREYVKSHYTRTGPQAKKSDLSFHKLYYLLCSEYEVKETFNYLKVLLRDNKKSVPTAKWIFAKIDVYKKLKKNFGNVTAGEIVYFQRGKDNSQTKYTVPVDLVVANDNKQQIFIFTSQSSVFVQKKEIPFDVFKRALLSVTSANKATVTFIGLFDKEPVDVELFGGELSAFSLLNYKSL